ncbi:UNVERIFIED_CONTAM: hypothetical protein FKN15_063515 [Acipenser sinensis]
MLYSKPGITVVISVCVCINPNKDVCISTAIQALRSVLNAFCVVNRKNMFVYQERTTKSVFYLRSVEGSRPVGQVYKHILLMVHGVEQAGSAHRYHPCADSRGAKTNTRCPPKRVPSAARFFTLCKLTVQPPQSYSVGGQRSSGQLTGKPAGAQPDYRGRWCAFIQPPGSPATEVVEFTLPEYSLPWLQAVAHYLRQNLLIFLHIPKYTDSNMEHHFKVLEMSRAKGPDMLRGPDHKHYTDWLQAQLTATTPALTREGRRRTHAVLRNVCRQPPASLHSANSPCSHLRATASEDNAALGSLQASPQAPSQTTGVAGVRCVLGSQTPCGCSSVDIGTMSDLVQHLFPPSQFQGYGILVVVEA